MLNANSGGDGYPRNWMRVCDICKAATSTLYCHTDSAYLCNCCDERIHGANSMALPHERVWIFPACEDAPPAFICKDEAASLRLNCDADINSANPLAHHHVQVPLTPLSGLLYAASRTYQEEPPYIMLDKENEISAPTTLEADEEETDSFLLLEPDNHDIQTDIGFTYGEELNESLNMLEYNSRTEYEYQDQKNRQQLYCTHRGDDSNDRIVPVQSFEEEEQEERLGQQQRQQNLYINGEYESSKAAFMNALSSSQSVPMSGTLPKETIKDMSSSYTRYSQGTTDLFPNFSFLMPLQFTPTNREAKVLRYREKRKARKFEKKIRYASRKAYAEVRPRVKGRFVRKTDMDFEVEEMFSIEDCVYGVVPSY